MQRFANILRSWLPLAVVTVGLCGLVYATVQQSLRQGLNDPQIQMAEDAAAALDAGQPLESLLPTVQVDVARSLAPFLIVYDDHGNVLASSAVLHGQTPELPGGVLDYTRENGQDRVSWQPEADVRIAAVVVRFESNQPGFVLAGRNMREVELREEQTGQLCLLAMAAILAGSLVMVALGEFFLRRKTTP
jgi:hypothetical protein